MASILDSVFHKNVSSKYKQLASKKLAELFVLKTAKNLNNSR